MKSKKDIHQISTPWFVKIFHNRVTAWAILAISLTLTVSAALISVYYAGKAAEERFSARANEIEEGIKTRMISYEQALRGGVGLFNSRKDVTRAEFREYVESLSISENLPGIQGIGFSIPIKEEEKESHTALIRSEGFPEYDIKPDFERQEYSSIIYLEPFDWRNKRAFGYDMWSNEMRKEAMTRARDQGVASNSGIITLVQETNEDVQKGFLMYLPVYENGISPQTIEDRKSKFKGWVYSPFRAGDLINGITGTSDIEYGFELYDGEITNQESLLFNSDSINHLLEKKSPKLSKLVKINSQGREWTLYIHTTPNVLSKQESSLPLLVGVSGFAVDIILFILIYSLNLEQRETKRLARLLEDQKSDIEIINKDLSQFAYITSHDLQEPLRTVSNCAKLLKDDYGEKLDDEANYLIQTMTRATTRMSSLIHAILEYSRLGKEVDMNESINCNKLINALKRDMNMLMEENSVKVIYQNLPTIKGNKIMIKQLFLNLITNSIKYRKKDVTPIIEIDGFTHPEFHEFTIKDNGIGIEPEYRERIFEIFQRLHNSAEYTGTGIGLSSCKKIVEVHNGTIEVSSSLDMGSIFKFTISK
ncbi:CHASE domain-containing protein [Ekhidna sp.]